jgi:tripartite-type tricarboxylate transporter receptor subunit TctC
MMKIRFLLGFALAAFAALAQAQPWPSKPVKLVVPFPAGGPTDVLSRVVAERLSSHIRQPVVVENKPGAGGAIGADLVAKSAPDGYTLVLATSSTHSVGPHLSKLPYDAEKDFTPIVWLGDAPRVLVASPKLGVANLKEFIALARKNPGTLNYASSGVGGVVHLATQHFATMAGIQLTHVPYKGIQQSIGDLQAGEVALLFDNIMTVQPHVKSGRLVALGISTPKRSPIVPEIPTIDEAGVPGFESQTWFGIYGPAGMPKAVVERANAELNKALADPAVVARFTQLGFNPAGGTPEEFSAMVRRDSERWLKVIRDNNIRAE